MSISAFVNCEYIIFTVSVVVDVVVVAGGGGGVTMFTMQFVVLNLLIFLLYKPNFM